MFGVVSVFIFHLLSLLLVENEEAILCNNLLLSIKGGKTSSVQREPPPHTHVYVNTAQRMTYKCSYLHHNIYTIVFLF